MRRTSIVAGGLLAAGSGLLVVQVVRSAVLWIVGPGSEYVAPAGATLLAAGSAMLLLRRARPVVAVVALLIAGILSAALARLIGVLAAVGAAGGSFIAYGPGSPPSWSWSLLAGQVAGPTLMTLALVLIAVGAVSAVVVARGHRRLRAE